MAWALAAVAACGSEGDTDSTTATIDSTTTGDSGDGDGDGDPACHCHAGDSCPNNDGVCASPPLLFVSVHQSPGQARPDLTAMVSEVPSLQVLVGAADRTLAYTPEGVSVELSVGYRPPAQTVTVVIPL